MNQTYNPFDKLLCTMTLTHCKYSPQLITQKPNFNSLLALKTIPGQVVTEVKENKKKKPLHINISFCHSFPKLYLAYPLGIGADRLSKQCRVPCSQSVGALGKKSCRRAVRVQGHTNTEPQAYPHRGMVLLSSYQNSARQWQQQLTEEFLCSVNMIILIRQFILSITELIKMPPCFTSLRVSSLFATGTSSFFAIEKSPTMVQMTVIFINQSFLIDYFREREEGRERNIMLLLLH